MDKCCKYCHYYNFKTGYCDHEDMFEIENRATHDDIIDLEFLLSEDGSSTGTISDLGFRVKDPEKFSCCYWA